MSVVVGLLQYAVRFGAPEVNLAEIARQVRQAPETDLLVLPELAVSGYDFPDADTAAGLAESFKDGPTRRLAETLAAERDTTLVIGYAERTVEGLYNSCMLVMPDGTAVNYRKIHLFNREQRWFLPGDAPGPVVETPAGRVGLLICFDWFFPEAARSLALRGAQILAQPANLVLPWCQRAMFARSVENRVFTITANRIGTDAVAGRELTFTGQSQILSPTGECLASASADAPECLTTRIAPEQADDKAVAGENDLFRNRRPHLYPGL